MTWLLVFLTVGCVARFTRLVTKDSITEPFRDWVEARAEHVWATWGKYQHGAITTGAPHGYRRGQKVTVEGKGKCRVVAVPKSTVEGGASSFAYRLAGGGPLGWWRRKYKGFWPWLDDLIHCPWCSSVWVGVPVAFVATWWGDNRVVVGGMLACTASWVAANVQAHAEQEDTTGESAK